MTRPLLSSMKWVKVTGLAVAPAGVRYLFARDRALAAPPAFAGARIRINESLTTENLLRSLGARPTTAVRHGRAGVEALQSGRLDAVEADIRTASGNGYIAAAPYIGSPIFAEVTTWPPTPRAYARSGRRPPMIRQAAERTATVQRAADDSTSSAATCGAGLRHAPSTPAQLDALQRAALDVHAALDARPAPPRSRSTASAPARRPRRIDDPWAQCGPAPAVPSPTRSSTAPTSTPVSKAAEARAGSAEANAGPTGWSSATAATRSCDPGHRPIRRRPGGTRSPIPSKSATVVLRGDMATMRPETSILFGSTPKISPLRAPPRPPAVALRARRRGLPRDRQRLAQGRLSLVRIVLCVLALALGGCSLGRGPSDIASGRPPPRRPGRTVTVHFASDSGLLRTSFVEELARVSGGRLARKSCGTTRASAASQADRPRPRARAARRLASVRGRRSSRNCWA